jgi:hypothetical protein
MAQPPVFYVWLALLLAAMLFLFVYLKRQGFRFRSKELLVMFVLVSVTLVLSLQLVAPVVNGHWAASQINAAGAEVFSRDRGVDLIGQTKNIRRVSVGQDAQALAVARHLDRIPDTNEIYLYMGVSDAGLSAICRREKPLVLDALVLETASITNAGLEHLTHLRELKTLSCMIPGFDETGIAHLTAVPGLQNLVLRQMPWKNGPVISEKSLRGIAELDQLLSLELRYEGNKVFYLNDIWLQHLHGLKRLKRLRITGCRVSEEALAELRAALPSCEVTISPSWFVEPNSVNGKSASSVD